MIRTRKPQSKADFQTVTGLFCSRMLFFLFICISAPELFVISALCLTVAYQPCASRGFTQTSFPNLLYHGTEQDAASALDEAAKAVFNEPCQEAALHYLCSLYFPKCDSKTGLQSFPCQRLCNSKYSYSHFLTVPSRKHAYIILTPLNPTFI